VAEPKPINRCEKTPAGGPKPGIKRPKRRRAKGAVSQPNPPKQVKEKPKEGEI